MPSVTGTTIANLGSSLTGTTVDLENDLLAIVDVSDTASAPTGKTKKITAGNLIASMSFVNVKTHGAACDGVTDDTAAVNAGNTAAVSAGVPLYFPGPCLVTSPIALTSAHNNLKWIAFGKELGGLIKGFNGDLVTVTGTQNFEAHNMHFDGQHGTFTGKGFVFSGTAHYPKFPGCFFEAFTDSHIEFGADSGYDFKAPGARFLLGSGQTNPRCIHVNGPDLGATHRHFVDCSLDGHYDFDGAQATQVTGGRFNTIETDADTSVLEVCGASWAASSAITINADNVTVTGCRVANSVTFSSGSSGAFIGNQQTSGTITDSSAAGNWTILHHEGGSSAYKIGPHFLDINASSSHEIQSARTTGNVGDANHTFNPGEANVILYQSAITAERTVTLSTTNARVGTRVRVVRQSAATGAFNVVVGSFNLTAEKQWIELTYDGSAYQITGYGTLP